MSLCLCLCKESAMQIVTLVSVAIISEAACFLTWCEHNGSLISKKMFKCSWLQDGCDLFWLEYVLKDLIHPNYWKTYSTFKWNCCWMQTGLVSFVKDSELRVAFCSHVNTVEVDGISFVVLTALKYDILKNWHLFQEKKLSCLNHIL